MYICIGYLSRWLNPRHQPCHYHHLLYYDESRLLFLHLEGTTRLPYQAERSAPHFSPFRSLPRSLLELCACVVTTRCMVFMAGITSQGRNCMFRRWSFTRCFAWVMLLGLFFCYSSLRIRAVGALAIWRSWFWYGQWLSTTVQVRGYWWGIWDARSYINCRRCYVCRCRCHCRCHCHCHCGNPRQRRQRARDWRFLTWYLTKFIV